MRRIKLELELHIRAKVVPWLIFILISNISAANGEATAEERHLHSFATRYASAWSSQDPAALAAFYVQDGVLQVNDGEPAIGRAAIQAKAKGFMEAFPDMVVKLESVESAGGTAVFRWLWTGTNSGPGGTGRAVRLRGYEEWTFAETGLIRQSLGHYDETDYQRQVNGTESEP